jgi:hypothetical protein
MAAETLATPTVHRLGWGVCGLGDPPEHANDQGSFGCGQGGAVLSYVGFPSVGNHRVDASNLEGHSHGLYMKCVQTW